LLLQICKATKAAQCCNYSEAMNMLFLSYHNCICNYEVKLQHYISSVLDIEDTHYIELNKSWEITREHLCSFLIVISSADVKKSKVNDDIVPYI
jgi:hypothetical protein